MGCCSSQMPLTDLRLHQIVYDESDPATHLGSGTTSDVYSGFHGPSGTPVAVKILCKTASITGKLSKSHGEDIEGARTEAAILKQVRRQGFSNSAPLAECCWTDASDR
jgi:hypothetical protein